ncbi:cell pole-organizing protein PopZ [Sphingomonas sp. SORGH_AS789]|nr:cell pole-organizing protein PopZ [Sphingomonas sp. SORGH_AS_0789]MDR6149913.1 cell pole-organizing protein PopZ [Sphingomonas sp. SORGH_AS_0742]
MGFAVMGDISAEPSMEEILSSIKRIIAEEGEAPTRQRRPARPVPSPAVEEDSPEVLELSDPMPLRMKVEAAAARAAESTLRAELAPRPAPEPAAAKPEPVAPAPVPAPAAPVAAQNGIEADDGEEAIVSPRAAEASRGSLEALSRMMVKPEPSSDGTLEGLVRDMLRPMLRDWLDANLPEMVEAMVAREIARITREGR